jgi:hypothetical protein
MSLETTIINLAEKVDKKETKIQKLERMVAERDKYIADTERVIDTAIIWYLTEANGGDGKHLRRAVKDWIDKHETFKVGSIHEKE